MNLQEKLAYAMAMARANNQVARQAKRQPSADYAMPGAKMIRKANERKIGKRT